MMITQFVIIAIVAVIAGAVIGIIVRKKMVESKLDSAEEYSRKVMLEASKQAETIRKEAQLQAKDKLYQMKLEFEEEHGLDEKSCKTRRNGCSKRKRPWIKRWSNWNRGSELTPRPRQA